MREASHVMPVNDLIQHVPSEDCVCGPVQIMVKQDWLAPGGDLYWEHYSLDGRELR